MFLLTKVDHCFISSLKLKQTFASVLKGLFFFQLQLLPSKDQKLLYQLGFEDDQMLFAKVSVSGVTTVPTKEEAEVIYNN